MRPSSNLRELAQAQGHSHLRAVCSGCGHITDLPWLLLLRRPVISRDTFIGNLPLRCQRCGNTDPIIGVRQHSTAYMRSPSKRG